MVQCVWWWRTRPRDALVPGVTDGPMAPTMDWGGAERVTYGVGVWRPYPQVGLEPRPWVAAPQVPRMRVAGAA